MFNVMVAIRKWGSHCKNKTVIIKCDNSATVCVLTSGKSVDAVLLACAREVWMQSAIHQFNIQPQHHPGITMDLTDWLSRRHLGAQASSIVQERLKGLRECKISQKHFSSKHNQKYPGINRKKNKLWEKNAPRGQKVTVPDRKIKK